MKAAKREESAALMEGVAMFGDNSGLLGANLNNINLTP